MEAQGVGNKIRDDVALEGETLYRSLVDPTLQRNQNYDMHSRDPHDWFPLNFTRRCLTHGRPANLKTHQDARCSSTCYNSVRRQRELYDLVAEELGFLDPKERTKFRETQFSLLNKLREAQLEAQSRATSLMDAGRHDWQIRRWRNLQTRPDYDRANPVTLDETEFGNDRMAAMRKWQRAKTQQALAWRRANQCALEQELRSLDFWRDRGLYR